MNNTTSIKSFHTQIHKNILVKKIKALGDWEDLKSFINKSGYKVEDLDYEELLNLLFNWLENIA